MRNSRTVNFCATCKAEISKLDEYCIGCYYKEITGKEKPSGISIQSEFNNQEVGKKTL